MIDKNFHTHTPRCKHAYGAEREYIEAAICKGFKTLGFSDHTPQPFENGFVSSIRMDMEELDGYVETLLNLREEYRDRIEIKIGLEVEYYPHYFERLMAEIRKRPIEYIILGQHFVPEEESGFYSGTATASRERLREYVDITIEGLKTGCFSYLAHPDLMDFVGSKHIYRKEMRRLCEFCSDNHIPLEVNILGFAGGRSYPRSDFFKLAADMGCEFILGCDAHRPEGIVQPEEIPGLTEFLKECGVKYSQEADFEILQ